MLSRNKIQSRFNHGFTLIEILLTISIIAIVAMFSLPISRQFLIKNDLETTNLIAIQNLHRAETLSMAGSHDLRWGVNFESGKITLFAIDDLNNQVPELEEIYPTPKSIYFSGITRVIFNKLTGETLNFGNLNIYNPEQNETKNVAINKRGLVSN